MRQYLRNNFWILVAYVMALFCIIFSRIYGVHALPNRTSEYRHLSEYLQRVKETDIEPSRSDNPQRKASVLKKPWLSDNLLDMETFAFPDFPMIGEEGVREYPVDYLLIDTKDGYDKGCAFYNPNILIEQHPSCKSYQYDLHMGILRGTVVDYTVSGPATASPKPGSGFMYWDVVMSPGIRKWDKVKVDVVTRSLKDGTEGSCTGVIQWQCEQDDCCKDFMRPYIYPNGSVYTLWPGWCVRVGFKDWYKGFLETPRYSDEKQPYGPIKVEITGDGYTLSTESCTTGVKTAIIPEPYDGVYSTSNSVYIHRGSSNSGVTGSIHVRDRCAIQNGWPGVVYYLRSADYGTWILVESLGCSNEPLCVTTRECEGQQGWPFNTYMAVLSSKDSGAGEATECGTGCCNDTAWWNQGAGDWPCYWYCYYETEEDEANGYKSCGFNQYGALVGSQCQNVRFYEWKY